MSARRRPPPREEQPRSGRAGLERAAIRRATIVGCRCALAQRPALADTSFKRGDLIESTVRCADTEACQQPSILRRRVDQLVWALTSSVIAGYYAAGRKTEILEAGR